MSEWANSTYSIGWFEEIPCSHWLKINFEKPLWQYGWGDDENRRCSTFLTGKVTKFRDRNYNGNQVSSHIARPQAKAPKVRLFTIWTPNIIPNHIVMHVCLLFCGPNFHLLIYCQLSCFLLIYSPKSRNLSAMHHSINRIWISRKGR